LGLADLVDDVEYPSPPLVGHCIGSGPLGG
jgi:hypothetical protein